MLFSSPSDLNLSRVLLGETKEPDFEGWEARTGDKKTSFFYHEQLIFENCSLCLWVPQQGECLGQKFNIQHNIN